MTRGTHVLVTALTVSLAGNAYLYWELSRRNAQVPYNQHFHGPLIEEAIKHFAAKLGVSRQEAMRDRFPVAMTIPDPGSPGGEMRCVSLDLREGMLGWVPVYCFNRNGLKREARF